MKYKVGDKVKIKTWEQMKSEFGLDYDGDIDSPLCFTRGMAEFCGEIHVISEAEEGEYRLNGCEGWSFADYMIEGLVEDVADPNPDPVNHPSHYCQEGSMECIDEMVAVFGKDAVMNFCLLNVWKYRKRAIFKNGAEDLKKSDWYMKKYCELKGDV